MRAFRKDKENMVIIFNNIDEAIYTQMVNYLKENTNSCVTEEDLSLTAIKLALERGDK